MSIDVNKAIQELLFDQSAVVVPGLGGFTSTAGAATVDYVQDVITPPASKLEFNPNLVLNDGILVQYLQKGNLSTYQEAEATVEKYVNAVRETLERREIYEIPKVGRLYQDYEQKIRFMPEGTNFNADSFGLPTVEFQPLVKEKAKPMPTSTKPMAVANDEIVAVADGSAAVAATAEEPNSALLKKALPWMVLLAAILIALTVYTIFGGKSNETVAERPEPTERVNTSPKQANEESSAATPSDDRVAETEQAPSDKAAAISPPIAEQKSTSPAPTNEPEKPTAPVEMTYMVVHSFGVKANANKFAQTLSRDGYQPQTKKSGSLYRVGILFAPSSQTAFENTRKELANKYKAGPKTEKELEEMGQ